MGCARARMEARCFVRARSAATPSTHRSSSTRTMWPTCRPTLRVRVSVVWRERVFVWGRARGSFFFVRDPRRGGQRTDPTPPLLPHTAGTPYQGGVFRLRLSLPADFPTSPPSASFATKIFHPNVATRGDVCVNVLKKDWAPALGLRHVLAIIRCLLIQPFPDSALNEEAGRLLQEDYSAFASRAALLTSVHATRGGGGGARAPAVAAPGGPLTAAGGGNAVNAVGEDGATAAAAAGRVSGDGDTKARPAPAQTARPAAAAKKRSLKRL